MRLKSVSVLVVGLVLLTLLIGTGGAFAQTGQPPQLPAGGGGSSFTYQGQLKSGSTPYDGVCDFQFTFYDAVTGGVASGAQTLTSVTVSKGLFTVQLGYTFTGQQRWLEVAVRCPAGSGAYITLSPRQMITAAPYAMSLMPGGETYYMTGAALTSYMRAPTSYAGVEGRVNGGSYGVRGASNDSGTVLDKFGVLGTASHGLVSDITDLHYYDAGGAFAGPNGVIGVASKESNYGYGVLGFTSGVWGRGVYGAVMTTTGQNQGVYGFTQSISGTGVYGVKVNPSYITPYGSTQTWQYAPGVWGDTSTGDGVWGTSSATNGYGVVGAVTGIGRGVYGVAAGSSGGVGVFGQVDNASGWAGQFTSSAGNGVYVSVPGGKAGLNVASGTKNAVVRTDQGSRLLYTEESAEVWFTDYGFGKLKNGVAVIPIDPLFAQTVNLSEPYHVFVQSYGDVELYVSQRTPTQFEVKARGASASNVEFSYRLVAKRLGYETGRLEPAPWADDDPNLYPEKQTRASDKTNAGGTPYVLPTQGHGQPVGGE
jgi:hypothetical protein